MESMIDQRIQDEIYMKLSKVNGDSHYSEAMKRSIVTALNKLGDVYSFWIENPDLRKDLLLADKQAKTVKKNG